MGLFTPTYRVIRTIWPYEKGWGVIREKFGEPLIVCSSGLTRKEAEEDLDQIKAENNK